MTEATATEATLALATILRKIGDDDAAASRSNKKTAMSLPDSSSYGLKPSAPSSLKKKSTRRGKPASRIPGPAISGSRTGKKRLSTIPSNRVPPMSPLLSMSASQLDKSKGARQVSVSALAFNDDVDDNDDRAASFVGSRGRSRLLSTGGGSKGGRTFSALRERRRSLSGNESSASEGGGGRRRLSASAPLRPSRSRSDSGDRSAGSGDSVDRKPAAAAAASRGGTGGRRRSTDARAAAATRRDLSTADSSCSSLGSRRSRLQTPSAVSPKRRRGTSGRMDSMRSLDGSFHGSYRGDDKDASVDLNESIALGSVFVHGMPEDNSFKTQISALREENAREHEEETGHLDLEGLGHEVGEEEMRIRVIVRKRPMSKQEAERGDEVGIIQPVDYEGFVCDNKSLAPDGGMQQDGKPPLSNLLGDVIDGVGPSAAAVGRRAVVDTRAALPTPGHPGEEESPAVVNQQEVVRNPHLCRRGAQAAHQVQDRVTRSDDEADDAQDLPERMDLPVGDEPARHRLDVPPDGVLNNLRENNARTSVGTMTLEDQQNVWSGEQHVGARRNDEDADVESGQNSILSQGGLGELHMGAGRNISVAHPPASRHYPTGGYQFGYSDGNVEQRLPQHNQLGGSQNLYRSSGSGRSDCRGSTRNIYGVRGGNQHANVLGSSGGSSLDDHENDEARGAADGRQIGAPSQKQRGRRPGRMLSFHDDSKYAPRPEEGEGPGGAEGCGNATAHTARRGSSGRRRGGNPLSLKVVGQGPSGAGQGPRVVAARDRPYDRDHNFGDAKAPNADGYDNGAHRGGGGFSARGGKRGGGNQRRHPSYGNDCYFGNGDDPHSGSYANNDSNFVIADGATATRHRTGKQPVDVERGSDSCATDMATSSQRRTGQLHEDTGRNINLSRRHPEELHVGAGRNDISVQVNVVTTARSRTGNEDADVGSGDVHVTVDGTITAQRQTLDLHADTGQDSNAGSTTCSSSHANSHSTESASQADSQQTALQVPADMGLFSKCENLSSDEKLIAGKSLEMMQSYKNLNDGLTAVQGLGREFRFEQRRQQPQPLSTHVPAELPITRHFSLSCNKKSSSCLNLVGRVSLPGGWKTLDFFLLSCDDSIAILATTVEDKRMVAYCNKSCLPAPAQKVLAPCQDTHNNFRSASENTKGIPCMRNGSTTVFLEAGKLKHRFVDSVMWERMQVGHLTYFERKTYTLWRYPLLNFSAGIVLSADSLLPIDYRTGEVGRIGTQDARRVLQIARRGIVLRTRTVRSRVDMLDDIETMHQKGPSIEEHDRFLQFALGGDPDVLPKIGKFIPCKVQIHRRLVELNSLGGDAAKLLTWRLTPCACDVLADTHSLKQHLSDLIRSKGGIYPHDRQLQQQKIRRKRKAAS